MERRGVFFLFSFLFLNFSFFPSTRDGVSFFIHFTPIKIIIYSFDALRPRGGPYFLLLQKVGKDRRKGVSPPCESPDQSGVLDAPLWKPPSLRWRGRPGRTPRRFAAGASVPLGKAASACALATIAAPPPLRVGGFAPLPPTFPTGERLPVMRAYWGLRPLAPKFPVGGRLPVMRTFGGSTPPGPQGSPLGNVCLSCANAHGTTFVAALRQRLRKSARKLLPRSG